MRKYLGCIAATLAPALLATATWAAGDTRAVDRILVNGDILTMDAARPRAQAIAIRGSDIVAVGSDKAIRKLRGTRTEVIDLQGKTVVPGLVDTHIHAVRGGQGFTFETYWHEQTTLAGALEHLKQEAMRRGANQWVAVTGAWSPEQFAEKRPPTPQDLTRAAPDNPAYVQYLYDYAVVNDKGIEALGLNAGGALPAGITVERDAQGQATGKLLGGIGPFNVLFARIGVRTPAQSRDSLVAFFSELNRHGVTGIIDPAAGDFPIYNALFDLWRNKALTLRVGYRAAALPIQNEAAWFNTALTFLPPLFGDDMMRFLGVGEALVFGMNDGVRMGPGFSPSQTSRDELAKVASIAAARRYPLEVHAYTDDAAKAILDVLEDVAKTHSIKDLRWAITHISTGSQDTFERMQKLGMSYTVQMGPYFEGPAIRDANGDATAQASPPTRLALSRGMVVAGGTDSTRVGVFNVWRAIEYHVTGRSAGGAIQRRADYLLTREEALRLHTANAAWISFDEQRKGTLTPGKLADLAVLNAPYLKVPSDRIHTLRSVLTLVGGKVVHLDKDGLRRGEAASAARPGVRTQALQSLVDMHRAKEGSGKGH